MLNNVYGDKKRKTNYLTLITVDRESIVINIQNLFLEKNLINHFKEV